MTRATNARLVPLLAETYKGIEGFYVINRAGELGFFSADGLRVSREPPVNLCANRQHGTAEQIGQAEAFLSEIRSALQNHRPDRSHELGYLLPADNTQLWQTATIVLHENIVAEFLLAVNRSLSQGTISLDEGDRLYADNARERGLHRGFDALLNHRSEFGNRPYFPMLYYLPAPKDPADTDHSSFRVINLLSAAPNVRRYSDILEKMQENLTERGALNEACRVEHRFEVSS